MCPQVDIETFVNCWVAKNILSISDLVTLPDEVDRLAARLTGDARLQGISGGDLHRAVGDIDEYLTEQYCLQSGLRKP